VVANGSQSARQLFCLSGFIGLSAFRGLGPDFFDLIQQEVIRSGLSKLALRFSREIESNAALPGQRGDPLGLDPFAERKRNVLQGKGLVAFSVVCSRTFVRPR
jgi:hypothetical protein